MTHHNWSMFQLTTHIVSALVVFSPVYARAATNRHVTNSCDHFMAQVTLKRVICRTRVRLTLLNVSQFKVQSHTHMWL